MRKSPTPPPLPWRTIVATAGVACLSAGCVVGPDFKPPDAAIAGRWAESGRGISTDPTPAVEWWKLFNDPVLNRLVRKANEQNLSLENAGLAVMRARAQLGIARGDAFPQVQQATGDFSYNRNPSYEPEAQFTAASVGLDASWELDLWGKYRRGIESANANLLASVAGYYDVAVSITAEVANTYITIRTLEQRILTAKKNIDIQTQATEITRALWDDGAKSELDFQQAQTTLFTTQAQVPALEISLKQAQHSLAILLGMPPQKMSGLLGRSAKIPTAPAIIAAGIPSDLLRRRPDIRQAAYQAAAQCAQIGVAEADLYPRLSLVGSIGWNASDVGAGSLGDLFNTTTFGGSLGPSATWDVLNYGRIKNNVRVQDAAFQQALTNYQQLVLSASGEVEDAIIGFEQSRVQVGLLQKSVDAAQRALNLGMLQYKEGQSQFQRVLDSTRTLAEQQDQLVQTQGNISLNAVALYKALAGGWQDEGVPDFVPEKTRKTMEERTDWGKLFPNPKSSDNRESGQGDRARRRLGGKR